MIPLLFLLACAGVLVLTAWSVSRMRRTQLLRLLAALTRRGLPLETALWDLSRQGTGVGEERLAGKVVRYLDQGFRLDEALSTLRAVTREQAAALELAARRGFLARILDLLSGISQREERYTLWATSLALYPLLIGLLLAGQMLFFSVFIAPKFEMMILEMDVTGPPQVLQHSFWCAYALFTWGILANSLVSARAGRALWVHVPALGTHVRMYEQARVAGSMALALEAGATLEETVDSLAKTARSNPYRRRLARASEKLAAGVAPLQAFRESGRWREELLWGLDAVTRGAKPGATLQHVAEVLEEKARSRLEAIFRIGTPLALLVAAFGVGALAHSVFGFLMALSEATMMP